MGIFNKKFVKCEVVYETENEYAVGIEVSDKFGCYMRVNRVKKSKCRNYNIEEICGMKFITVEVPENLVPYTK